jgi:predicted nucleic acid binding AN1-type Zn finger protein
MSTPSLKVVVAVTSPIAFEPLNKNSILSIAFGVARAFSVETSITTQLAVAVKQEDAHRVTDLKCEILICEPNSPVSLAQALKRSQPFDLVAIHDSQRPLARTAQFHRTIEALIGDIDAVRPAAAFTETLKSITSDQVIEKTIDRTSMLRVSTPEIIRFDAIDFAGSESNWFIPLKAKIKKTTVDADPESLRVNTIAEISLMESFVHWQQTVAR